MTAVRRQYVDVSLAQNEAEFRFGHHWNQTCYLTYAIHQMGPIQHRVLTLNGDVFERGYERWIIHIGANCCEMIRSHYHCGSSSTSLELLKIKSQAVLIDMLGACEISVDAAVIDDGCQLWAYECVRTLEFANFIPEGSVDKVERMNRGEDVGQVIRKHAAPQQEVTLESRAGYRKIEPYPCEPQS